MTEVGIRELRASLRRWLRRARAGEEIVVTERGRPVAKIVPATWEDALARLVEAGIVTPPQRPKRPSRSYPRVNVKGSLSDIVIQQRR
jgi:prevent-host-death family protein